MRALAAVLLFSSAAGCATAGPVTSVTVRNAQFQVVKVLAPEELGEFNRQWQEKKETEAALKDAGGAHFKLDVENEKTGGRWLYYTTGFVSLLAHNRQPVYKVSEPGEFNRLIGAEK